MRKLPDLGPSVAVTGGCPLGARFTQALIVLSTKSVQQIYLPGATRILKKRCSQGCVPRTRDLSAPGTLEGRTGTMSAAYTPLHVTVAREMLRHGSVVYNTHKTQ